MVFLSKICGKTYCIILHDLYSSSIRKIKNLFLVLYNMAYAKLLQWFRSSEKSGRVACRLGMLLVLLNMKSVFTATVIMLRRFSIVQKLLRAAIEAYLLNLIIYNSHITHTNVIFGCGSRPVYGVWCLECVWRVKPRAGTD